MTFDLKKILRKNIRELVPYSSARDDYKGKDGIFLDANENAFGSPVDGSYNRYPDPLQSKLKAKLAPLKGLLPEHIFIGNGSDEAIDILFRAFCEPGRDHVIVCPPTYGMYSVAAHINDVTVVNVPLLADTFQLNVPFVLQSINENTKLIFICCPNNPTGNGVAWTDIKSILECFSGIMVIDEAYIDFAFYGSLIPQLANYPNLVILQTLSKAWGLAGLRVGMAFASSEIISVFNKIKPPYNINVISQQLAEEALDNGSQVAYWIGEVISERNRLMAAFQSLPFVVTVYASEANFFLVKTTDADAIYQYLVLRQVIIRNRSSVMLCEGCLRITVGTPTENNRLLYLLKTYTG